MSFTSHCCLPSFLLKEIYIRKKFDDVIVLLSKCIQKLASFIDSNDSLTYYIPLTETLTVTEYSILKHL